MQTVTSQNSPIKWGRKTASSLILPLFLAVAGVAAMAGCDRNAPAVLQESKINAVNYDKIALKMSQDDVKNILGAPSSADTKDMVIYKKTTFNYSDGDKWIKLEFKNDELESKDSNLQTK